MSKFSGGSIIGTGLFAGLMMASMPAQAVAQRKVIENDLSKCANNAGPAMLVEVSGFERATGKVRVQAYPATSSAWLEKGGWINRIEEPVQASGGKMRFCVPLPAAGRYGIAVRHDSNGNGKTDLSQDGGGFSNNPKLSIFNLGRPSVDKVAVSVGNGVTSVTIKLQYM